MIWSGRSTNKDVLIFLYYIFIALVIRNTFILRIFLFVLEYFVAKIKIFFFVISS